MTRHALFTLLATALLPAAAVAAAAPAPAPAAARPTASAVTDAEVGDADSFGRDVRWLGVVTGSVRLAQDCTADPGDTTPCATLSAAPTSTTFDFAALDTLTLPARSAASLLCHAQTPITNWFAVNPTASPAEFQFRVTPYYVVQSEVLEGLSNPNTGVPYAGRFELPLTGIFSSRTLAPGASEQDLVTGTRGCIGGLVTKSSLVSTWGLTEAQAEQFFRRPVTITLGIRGSARLVEDASIYIGTRFTGD